MGKAIDGKELGPGYSQRKDGRYVRSFRRADGKVGKVYGKTLKEARQKYKEALVKIEIDKGLSNGKVTVKDYFDDWSETRYRYNLIRASSYVRYRSSFKVISKEIGTRQMRSISPHDIEKLQTKLRDENGLSIVTIRGYMGMLSEMFDSAVRKHIIAYNPFAGAERLKKPLQQWPEGSEWGDRKNARALSHQEMEMFCEKAKGTYYENVIRFLFATGVRQGEMRALQWNDIDYEKEVVMIRRTYSIGKDGQPEIHLPKTRNGIRDIPVNNLIKEILSSQKKVSEDLFGEVKGNDLIFRSIQGKPIPRTTLRSWFWQTGRKMPKGFAPISSHSCRHTFVTLMISNGVSPYVVKDLVGHSHGTPDGTMESSDITVNVYLGKNKDAMKEAMDKAASLF